MEGINFDNPFGDNRLTMPIGDDDDYFGFRFTAVEYERAVGTGTPEPPGFMAPVHDSPSRSTATADDTDISCHEDAGALPTTDQPKRVTAQMSVQGGVITKRVKRTAAPSGGLVLVLNPRHVAAVMDGNHDDQRWAGIQPYFYNKRFVTVAQEACVK